MIKYNDSNIYVGYIKQLLHTFNLPQCVIGERTDKQAQLSFHYIKGNSLYFYNSDENTTKRIQHYTKGEYIEGITKNLEIRNNIYDSYTHEYLGEYLRFIRDYDNIDLMGMYNCFSNVTAKNVNLTVKNSTFDTSSKEYTIFVFPVKFGREYTIALDWHSQIEVFADFYSNGVMVTSNKISTIRENTYEKFSGTRFNHPVLYTKLSELKVSDLAKEKCLKLFIKIPSECKSSIVILEGNHIKDTEVYLENGKQYLGNKLVTYIQDIDISDGNIIELPKSQQKLLGYDYITKRQLLQLNTKKVFLLADRLIEYLSANAVTPTDEVIDNISNLQDKIKWDKEIENPNFKREFKDYYPGIWNNEIREYLYSLERDAQLTDKYTDLEGYLDKDVEAKIGGFEIKNEKYEEIKKKWQVNS